MGLNRGVLSRLETTTKYSDAEKIKYAWRVLQSAQGYNDEERHQAQSYLKKYFDLSDEELEQLPNLIKFPPFEKLKPLESSKQLPQSFYDKANEAIFSINQLITSYNKTTAPKKRIKLLKAIYEQYQLMEISFYLEMEEKCIPFQQIHQHLFAQLKQQLEVNQLISMSDLQKSKFSVEALASSKPLVEIIANLSPDESSKFAGILSEQRLDLLRKKPYLEEFLENNAISFLGGKNSQNYLITPNDGSPPYVLKLENRLGNPKLLEQHLRQDLADVFAPEAISRQVIYEDMYNKSYVSFLTINGYCGGGDIESFATSIEGSKIYSALELYTQMATILIALEKQGAAFPDMKNTNWLVDRDKKLRIADTKSLLQCQAGKINLLENPDEHYLYSKHLYLPEQRDKKPLRFTEQIHAFMFGKNLYQYLTGCQEKYLENKYDGKNLNFDYPVFKGIGSQLKDLICSLVKDEPSQRCSMSNALKKLEQIRKLIELNRLFEQLEDLDNTVDGASYLEQLRKKLEKPLSKESITQLTHEIQTRIDECLLNKCPELLAKIRAQSFGAQDKAIEQFLANAQSALDNKSELKQLKSDLEKTLKGLENPILTEIHRVINDFKKRSHHWYTVGMRVKAEGIEAEMAKLSIAERVNLMTDKNLEQTLQFVMEKMGTHRTLGGQLFLTPENKIDETKASVTYHRFKEKLKEIKSKGAVDNLTKIKLK